MSFEIGGTQVFSLEEVSLKLGVSTAQLRRCIRRGELHARKVGNHYFVTTPNLLAFLAGPGPSGPGGAPAPAASEEPAAALDAPAAAPPLAGEGAPENAGSTTRRRKRGHTSRTPRPVSMAPKSAVASGAEEAAVPEPAPVEANIPAEPPVQVPEPPPTAAEPQAAPAAIIPPPAVPETSAPPPPAEPVTPAAPPAPEPQLPIAQLLTNDTPVPGIQAPSPGASATPENRPTDVMPPAGTDRPTEAEIPAVPASVLSVIDRPTEPMPEAAALAATVSRAESESPAPTAPDSSGTLGPTEPETGAVPATADVTLRPTEPEIPAVPQSALETPAAPPPPAVTVEIATASPATPIEPTAVPAPVSETALFAGTPPPPLVEDAPEPLTSLPGTLKPVDPIAHPPVPPAARAFESLEALFDMPELSVDAPVVGEVAGPGTPEEPATIDAKRRRAAEATRRRMKSKSGDDAPPTGSLHEMLDAEGLNPPATDLPGSSPATETRFVTRSTDTGPAGATLDALDEGGSYGPEAATVILSPTDPGVNQARERLLRDTVQEGRIAQKARDEVVATIRSLPMAEQNIALAGPIGEQLVKLDRVIEEGVRAQKELGIAPPAGPSVITAVHRKTESPPAKPPAQGTRRFEGPSGEELTVPPSWLPVTPELPPEPAPAPPPAVRTPPKGRDGIGGETWQEVGLPTPAGGESGGKTDSRKVERITLTLTEEERALLAERQILEEMAIHEIMRASQPTSQRAWEQAKERFFAPMKAKSRRLEDATPAPRHPGRD